MIDNPVNARLPSDHHPERRRRTAHELFELYEWQARCAEMQPLRALFTKSIVARTDLPAGTVLQPEHLALKKPGTGLPEEKLPAVLGSKLKRDVKADTLILNEHFE